ncbi:hypothetical protein ASPVEDRAFT_86246 [Aspergillus versicolor CBS 583.65]|uniref:FAD-binding PCMH-type domain-containing protein n=1 Tax=Aspergillus versicolor CBS 583.65 TaxID=1036611 RepID=A0A1L9PTM0_ASPVE|nr:uncharacterized protein ASPVEDRAFT_86246 [Aspergillus versicolor CBS 583.65]OJJ04867.1 hypothetical protein ASPVEDRAFT_86246 [Aspergillus versicolor CBS 583.65]
MISLFSYLTLAVLPAATLALPYPFNIAARTPAQHNLTSTSIITQLGPMLSSDAAIYAHNDDRWENATSRWQSYSSPDFTVVVEAGTESDVPVIVKYANSYGIPFLAVNTGHGAPKSLGTLRNGIEISMRQLNEITIAQDGESAFFGGGVYSEQVIRTLWDEGYVAGTGSCACVGIIGPTLGGGHGRYQGFYGLIIDMLISMNVVLADGSTVTVSNSSHPDLWWAMRGAGHNFGIVTSFEADIHPRTVDEWYIHRFVFTQDKLEAVFEIVNAQQMDEDAPVELMNYGVFTWNAEFSTTEPILEFFIHYVGTANDAAPFLEPYEALDPVVSTGQYHPYPDVPDATGTGVHSPMCQHGKTNMQFPFGLLEHNITATRQIYDYFANVTAAQPVYNQSIVVFEAYSLQGVQAVDPAESAFPHRADRFLCDVLITYDPDSSLDNRAIAIGKQISRLWAEGQPGQEEHIYVNYAFGDEPLEQVYGYEPWRLDRLRAAKARYDPNNIFRYYNPLVRST